MRKKKNRAIRYEIKTTQAQLITQAEAMPALMRKMFSQNKKD